MPTLKAGNVVDVDNASSPFLRACMRHRAATVPVWFMRQAGRSLPEYRALKGDLSILEAVARPDLAAEITLQPVRRYGVDAAILFSDIMAPLAAIGVDLDVVAGKGPIIAQPFQSDADLARLRPLDMASDAPYVAETIKIAAKELDVPVIGFAGGPFTLASYLIEGGPSRVFAKTKTVMQSEPRTWSILMDKLADLVISSLSAQVAAGASAVQLFDSWIGCLAPGDYADHVLGATRRIFTALDDLGIPRIYFGANTSELLGEMSHAGAEVIGVDWRVKLDDAWQRIGQRHAIQGNLDPAACLAPWSTVAHQARKVLREAGGRPGHIFNLGHGVLPETDPEVLERLVALVHAEGSSEAATGVANGADGATGVGAVGAAGNEGAAD